MKYIHPEAICSPAGNLFDPPGYLLPKYAVRRHRRDGPLPEGRKSKARRGDRFRAGLKPNGANSSGLEGLRGLLLG